MTITHRAAARVFGFILVCGAAVDAFLLPVIGLNTPVPGVIDTFVMIVGAALLLFGI